MQSKPWRTSVICDRFFNAANHSSFLSHRLLNDYDAIVDAACIAWNRLCAETGRITSLASYPWILKVKP